jgi:hypothetical protein
MSARGEEVLVMKKEEEKKPQMCVISKSGLSLMGFHLSWVVIVLVAVLVYFYLSKNDMLSASVNETISSPAVESVAPTMTGGFKQFSVGNPGQVRKMMGH